MDYKECAEELMYYVLLSEERVRFVQNNITELAHGELAVLRYLLTEKDGANAKDFSRRFEINTSRVAAILKGLVKKGYIDRQSDPDDRRMIRIYITEAGRNYAEKKRETILTHCSAMLERLGEEETGQYVRIMKHISEIFGAMREEERMDIANLIGEE